MKATARAIAVPAASVTLLAVPTLTTPAHADSVPAVNVISSALQNRIAGFWTATRMRNATPLDTLARTKRVSGTVRRGLAAQAPASLPTAVGGSWTGGGKVTHTAGRVFFTYAGQAASCSGDAVTSHNRSTVITAGHCVKLDGKWHTNWVFVPGYHDGKAPYGKWTAKQTLTTPQWKAAEDLKYDVGAAVVNRRGGRALTSVVGGQGIAFGQKRDQTMYDFGYPAETPYDGTKLTYCSGDTVDDPLGSGDLGMACTMNGGSSGGPWFLKFNEKTGTGVQNSVNSFKYTFLPTHMFGPYFGADAKRLYDKAQNT